MSVTVIYKAQPGPELKAVLSLLRQARLHPLTLGNSDPVIVQKSYGLCRIPVAVPQEEAARARKIMAESEARSAPVVQAQSRLFIVQLLISVVIGLCAAAIVWGVERSFEKACTGCFWVTVLSLIAISNLFSGKKKSKEGSIR
jgi:hypothetical protein